MRIPDPKANTTTEAYLAYKAGYLEESELKPVLYEPYLHFDAWLAYWAGLTSDYPHRIGKNLLNASADTGSLNGVNYIKNGDGTYTANGTANGTSSFVVGSIELTANTQYVVSGCPSNGSGSSYNVRIRDANYTALGFDVGNGATITPTETKTYYYQITVVSGYSVSNLVFKPMICLSTTSNPDYAHYEPYTGGPEMLTDEEALVAYLSGVTDTYPEEIKDPYDVRIVGYLKYLVSARWGRPDYPVNNEEFYLSTMKPPVVPSGDTPSSDIEMDDTVEAPFIDLKMYGDTSQQNYSGKNLFNIYDIGGTSTGDNRVSYTVENGELTITQVGTKGNGYVWVKLDKDKLLGKELTLSVGEATSYGGSTGSRIRFCNQNGGDISGVSFTFYPDDETSETFSVPSELPSGVTELRLYIYVNKSNVTGQEGATSKYTKLQIEVGDSVTSYEPYVGGEPAPNPDYPQEIQTVTGEQMVNVRGKNYLELDGVTSNGVTGTMNSDGSFTLTGKATATGGFRFGRNENPYLPAGTYTLTIGEARGSNVALVINSGGENITVRITPGNTSATVTIASAAIGIGLFIGVTSGVTYNETFKIQLTAGSEPDYDFVPYRNQSYTINLGKNILNNNSPDLVAGTATWTPTDTGGRISNSVVWGDGVQWRFKDLSVGGKYTFHAEVGATKCYLYVRTYTDGSFSTVKTRLVSDATGDITRTITPDSPYVSIALLNNTTMNNVEIKNLQFELGDTFTGYAPYFEPIELCKIGDYQDYIYRDADGDWYLHKETDSLTLAVADMNNTDSYPGWKGVRKLITQFGGSVNEALARHSSFYTNISGFVEQDSSASPATGVMLNTHSGNNGLIFLSMTKYRLTQTQWKTNYQALIFKIYYGLPDTAQTDTQITNSELIAQLDALMEGGSYEDKTFIKATATDPNLPGLLYVEAGKYD